MNDVCFLLVDDLEENLLSLEGLLRRPGLKILKAKSGPEALELLLQHEVALALLDVQMPVMDGFELAELMRGSERTRSTPIIFLTAGSFDRDRRFRGYEAGAVDFIYKPIDADILKAKASIFFDLFRQRQKLAEAAEENARLLAETRRDATALAEADKRKDEFLATLAHELRNPLAPIRNGVHILRHAPDRAPDPELLAMMDRQLTHLVRLIDDLLDVSRVSTGKVELKRTRTGLQAAIQQGIEASRPLIEAHRHQLKTQIPDGVLWVDGDATRLAQIVGNLLNNAAKYTPEGGRIEISLEADAGQAEIAVKDNGLGIPADMLPKIFDLFTQVDSSLERSQGGLGIGLALVRQLAQLHGGTIHAESQGRGQGSRFVLRLPLIAAPVAETPTQSPASEKAPGSGLDVLVVDDNVASAQTTGWMLEMIGHRPVLAHEGNAALEKARDLRPDAILLDIGLPGMNGYEVCRALRKDASFANTVIIAQTGWGQERDRAEAKAAGFDHHLTKPVRFEDFAALLETIPAKV